MTQPSPEGYFSTRFTEDPRRQGLWRHLARYFSRYISPDHHVLELGAGYCYFSNAIDARRRVALDLGEQVVKHAAPGVEPVVSDALAYLQSVADGSFDVVFASNFLEHFDWPALDALIVQVRRVLKPGGRLLLVQPNFRLEPRRYFDDYTHRTIFTDVSLTDWIQASGFEATCVPRFLPFTVKSRLGGLSFLIPLYLALPWRPFAGQMLVVGRRTP